MKAKTISIGIVSMFMFQCLLAQEYKYVPFPDSNVIWSEEYTYTDAPPEYERFALNGEDTVINEKNYKKLYIFYDTVFNKKNARCIGGIREDSAKRIYYTGEYIHSLKPVSFSVEILLYDFSLGVNDTLWNGNFDPPEYLVVSDIDTIQIDNTLRKEYSFYDYFWVKWIEGIGNINGLLFTSGDLPTGGCNNNLLCFKQNDTILYLNGSECMPFISDIKKNTINASKIKIYPNPVNDGLMQFDFGKIEIQDINIMNCKGDIIEIIDVKGKTSASFYTNNYLSGIYLYTAIDKDGKKYSGKFVVR